MFTVAPYVYKTSDLSQPNKLGWSRRNLRTLKYAVVNRRLPPVTYLGNCQVLTVDYCSLGLPGFHLPTPLRNMWRESRAKAQTGQGVTPSMIVRTYQRHHELWYNNYLHTRQFNLHNTIDRHLRQTPSSVLHRTRTLLARENWQATPPLLKDAQYPSLQLTQRHASTGLSRSSSSHDGFNEVAKQIFTLDTTKPTGSSWAIVAGFQTSSFVRDQPLQVCRGRPRLDKTRGLSRSNRWSTQISRPRELRSAGWWGLEDKAVGYGQVRCFLRSAQWGRGGGGYVGNRAKTPKRNAWKDHRIWTAIAYTAPTRTGKPGASSALRTGQVERGWKLSPTSRLPVLCRQRWYYANRHFRVIQSGNHARTGPSLQPYQPQLAQTKQPAHTSTNKQDLDTDNKLQAQTSLPWHVGDIQHRLRQKGQLWWQQWWRWWWREEKPSCVERPELSGIPLSAKSTLSAFLAVRTGYYSDKLHHEEMTYLRPQNR